MDLVNREDVIWITKETGALDTQRRVKELPAVDAVQVVRCKDCISSEMVKCRNRDILYCNIHEQPFPENGFCNCGEIRR